MCNDNLISAEINECATISPTQLMPSPAEDQWLPVKMCNQEVTNCEKKALQNLSVLTVWPLS